MTAFALSLMVEIVHRLLSTLPPSAMMTNAPSPLDTSALRLLAALLHRPLTTGAPSAMLTKAQSQKETTRALRLMAKITHLLLTNLTLDLIPNGMLILPSDLGPTVTLISSPRTALCPMATAAPSPMTTILQTAILN